MEPTTESKNPASIELSESKERIKSRQDVVGALNGGLSLLDKEIKHSTKTDPELVWIQKSVKDAKAASKSQNGSRLNTFYDPQANREITLREGIPVDHLISFLEKKAGEYPQDSDESKKLIDWATTLKENSLSLYEARQKLARKGEDTFRHDTHDLIRDARIRQEANLIAGDPDRDKGNMISNYYAAEKLLEQRLELVIPPPQKKEPTKKTPNSTVPTPAEEGEKQQDVDNALIDTPPPIEPQDSGQTAQAERPEDRHIHGRLVSTQDLVDMRAQITAMKDVNADQRAGRIWELWRLPRKIGLRLAEGGIINTRAERLSRAMTTNNTSFLEMGDVRGAVANAGLKRQQAEEENQAILERFGKGRVLEQGREQQLEATGALRQEIFNELLRPIVIPNPNRPMQTPEQLRQAIAEFVRARINDPRPDVRRQIESIFGSGASDFGRVAENFATDLLEMGIKVRESMARHSESLEQMDQYIHIHLGLARETTNTDIRTATDRAVAWARRRQNESLARGARSLGFSGIVLNPAVVGVSVSLGTQGILRAVGWGGRAAALPSFVAGGIGGAAIAGGRRYIELGRDRRMDLSERERGEVTEQVRHARTRLGQLAERVAGGYRREDLEEFAYDMASPKELLEGGGTELVGGGIRQSIESLLSRDLSVRANREAAARRLTEIKTRLNRGQRDRSAWIRGMDQQNLNQLLDAEDRLRTALEGSGNDTVLLEQNNSNDWDNALDNDHQQKDRGFSIYRARNAAGAALFGGLVGAGAGLGLQEAVAVGRRIAGDTGVGRTVVENIIDRRPATEWFNSGSRGFSVEQTRELYRNPGNLRINNNLTLAIDGKHSASLIDNAGNKVPTPPLDLKENGNLVFSGRIDNLPPDVRDLVKDWPIEINTDPTYNLQEAFKAATLAPDGTGHETFQHGDWVIDVNSGPGHQMSMTHWPSQTQIHGFIKPGGVLDIDSTFGGNGSIAPAEWNDMRGLLQANGWATSSETVSGRSLFGPEGEWKNFSTNVDHREWYSYDRPGSQQNELRLDDYRDGNKVILDMTRMQQGFQSGLNPNPINVQEVINKHEGGFYFTTPDLPQDGIWVSDGVDGVWDGKLALDPGDTNPTHVIQTSKGPLQLGEFSKMILNQDALQKYPNGNIATEVFDRQDVFNLGKNGQDGFIEAGRIVQKDGVNVLQDFATIRGISEAQPTIPKEIFTFEPPIATEFTPPGEGEIPIFPIPFAPRHPLKPLVIPKPDSPHYRFGYEHYRHPDGRPYRLAEIIRFRSPQEARERIASRSGSPDNSQTGDNNQETPNTTEGEEALRLINETFIRSPHIYVVLSGAIGDVAITSAYLEGVRQYAEKLGQRKAITIIVPKNIAPIIQPLANKLGYEIVHSDRYTGPSKAHALMEERGDKDALALEFEHHTGKPLVNVLPSGNLIVEDLFEASVALYDNNRAGAAKFTEFFTELMSIPDDQKVDIQPRLDLPVNSEEIYRNLKTKYKINEGKNQVAVVVEASHKMKRYSLAKWKEVLEQISKEEPNTEFNIIFNPTGTFSQNDLQNVFGSINGVRYVGENLEEQFVFLSRQKLVLSNDTGLAHIAAVVEKGPQVVSLHLPIFPPSSWVTNTKRHTGITPPFNIDFNSEENDENKKLINQIPSEEVTKKSLEFLRVATPFASRPLHPDAELRVERLTANLNQVLGSATTQTANIETTPEIISQAIQEKLEKLVKTTSLKQAGAKVNIKVQGNRIILEGNINSMEGTSRFSQEYIPSQNGQFIPLSAPLVDINDKMAAKLEREQLSELRKQIYAITSGFPPQQIKQQVSPAWETSGARLENGKIVLDFKKKPTPQPAAATPTTSGTPDSPEPAAAEAPPIQVTPEQGSENENVLADTITAEMNQGAANTFANSLRGRALETFSKHNYGPEAPFTSTDIIDLANRWEVPIMLIVTGNHFVLGLQEPEQHEGKWRGLVYDPMKNSELWHDLPEWTKDYNDTSSWRAQIMSGVYLSKVAHEQLVEGKYNLSLDKDQEIADHPNLYNAKQARVQFDWHNCGPLSLFAAALRAGAKEGSSAFKETGKDLLNQDTGVKILTREEIFAKPTTSPEPEEVRPQTLSQEEIDNLLGTSTQPSTTPAAATQEAQENPARTEEKGVQVFNPSEDEIAQLAEKRLKYWESKSPNTQNNSYQSLSREVEEAINNSFSLSYVVLADQKVSDVSKEDYAIQSQIAKKLGYKLNPVTFKTDNILGYATLTKIEPEDGKDNQKAAPAGPSTAEAPVIQVAPEEVPEEPVAPQDIESPAVQITPEELQMSQEQAEQTVREWLNQEKIEIQDGYLRIARMKANFPNLEWDTLEKAWEKASNTLAPDPEAIEKAIKAQDAVDKRTKELEEKHGAQIPQEAKDELAQLWVADYGATAEMMDTIIPTKLSRSDEQLAENYWANIRPENKDRLADVINTKIKMSADSGKIYFYGLKQMSDLSDTDRQLMAAIKQAALEMGYAVGDFLPREGHIQATIRKAP